MAALVGGFHPPARSFFAWGRMGGLMGDQKQTYTLTGLTEKHLRVIMKALDFTGRMACGQFRELYEVVDPRFKLRHEVRERCERMLDELKSVMIPELTTPHSSWGIRAQEISDDHRVGYDVIQVVRHRLAWDRNPKGDFTVDFDEPWRTSEQVRMIGIRAEDPTELPPPPDVIYVKDLDVAVSVPVKKGSKKPAPKKPVKASKEKPESSKPRKFAAKDTPSKSLRSAMQVPLCNTKVACDGNTLFNGRTMCLKCEEALAKKAKNKDKAPVLKGVPSRKNRRRSPE